jgi:hypothetical protein
MRKDAEEGMWTVDDLAERLPKEVLQAQKLDWEYKNPSPAKPDK